jgi:hypothetical protein
MVGKISSADELIESNQSICAGFELVSQRNGSSHKNGVEKCFEELFSQIEQKLYPSWVHRTFTNDRECDALVCLKIRIRPFYEEIYGLNQFFDIITDETFGHKVIKICLSCMGTKELAKSHSMLFLKTYLVHCLHVFNLIC